MYISNSKMIHHSDNYNTTLTLSNTVTHGDNINAVIFTFCTPFNFTEDT